MRVKVYFLAFIDITDIIVIIASKLSFGFFRPKLNDWRVKSKKTVKQ